MAAFAQNHVPLNRYQMVEHFQTAAALTQARVGFAFLPASAKKFVPDEVSFYVLRAFRFHRLDTFALWSTENPGPLIQRVLNLLKEVRQGFAERPRR